MEARIQAQINAQTVHLRMATANLAPAFQVSTVRVACPRIRVSVPRMPAIKMPLAPEIHINRAGNGPV
jgi:hypothetical protein